MIGQLGILGLVLFELFYPLLAGGMAASADSLGKVFAHPIGDKELGIFRPSIVALGQLDLFFAERLTVGGGSILLVRSAVGNVTVHDNQGGTIVGAKKNFEGALQHL